MCGITGIITKNRSPIDRQRIETMTRALAHRGPDGEGFLLRENIALGHRRLSIIDLEFGKQPMSNEDGSAWITYNGELYNYRELKKELQADGHLFRTNSDTEVIIHAYEQWGEECIRRFRGMFAFAMADFTARKIFLSRDQFGIKPLYYRVDDGYFAFASEIEALRLAGGSPLSGDLDALDLYLRYQYIPAPQTIFRNVFKLAPAHFMVITFDGIIEKHERYWTPIFKEPLVESREETIERVNERITESVRAHLVSDVPFGVFLSGGIDSTLVAWKMSELLGREVQAFSIGFSEKEYSELAYAETAARELGIRLHTEIVAEKSLADLPGMVKHFGEPFGDSSIVPTWHVSRLARKYVPMVLSGDGGDEGFGGYDAYNIWMQSNPWRDAVRTLNPLHPRSSMRALAKAFRFRPFNLKTRSIGEWEEIMTPMQRLYRKKFWKKGYRSLINKQGSLFREASRLAQTCGDRFSYAQCIDYQTYLPNDILAKVDIAGMYWGLEVRPPLIDLKLFEAISILQTGMKYDYRTGAFNGKLALKGILSRRFNREFIERPKQGFTVPRFQWFLPGAQASVMLKEVLSSTGSSVSGLFDISYVNTLLEAHGTNGRDFSGVLWLLLVLFLWFNDNQTIGFSRA
jgi:asparagine synthase (glutamine-hydrolysing)